MPIVTIAQWVESAFNLFYYRTPEDQDPYEYNYQIATESWCGWEREGDPITNLIEDEVNCSQDIANDITQILAAKNYDRHKAEIGEESDFDVDSYYSFKCADNPIWDNEWSIFEDAIKTKSRFFNSRAESLLEAIFDDIENLSTADGLPTVINAGPKSRLKVLYRARVFQNEQDLVAALTRS